MTKKLDWNKYFEAAITVAEEGTVMLENNGVLPLSKGTKVALFGRMQNHYYKSGSGSGGMVNVTHIDNIREVLENEPDIVLDEELLKEYEQFDIDTPISKGIGWGQEPWSQEEMSLTDEMVDKYASRNDVAIMVIARLAGEDRDNVDDKGAYRLADKEEEMIAKVCAKFSKTIVLLNVGNVIDMNFVDKYKPGSVLYVWQGGMIGARAIPNILTGRATPSGHLTDTIAKEIEDYPSTSNFGIGDGLKDIYQEDIFVGYRYFETFAPEKVMYPFGYGLSYTTFEYSDVTFEKKDNVKITVKVTNTGSYKGQQVAMVFASCPQGVLGKPARELCGFEKTRVLNPGESETLVVEVNPAYFASYDDGCKTDFGYSWVLEAGKYNFYLGDNVRDAKLAGSFELSETVLVEKLDTALAPIEEYDRMTAKEVDGKVVLEYAPVATRTKDALASRIDNLPEEIIQTGDKGIKFQDVKSGKNTMDEFIAQLDDEELTLIVRGEGMGSPKVTTGTAGAFGGLSKELQAMGVPACCCSDGPSGMRIDSGKYAFATPNGTCIASTFSKGAVTNLFEYFGIEMLSNEIDVILGPGMNIHRHPLNGRNFEYFSEDPYLTGIIAASELQGLHKNGVTGCIKHFCVNNREHLRQFMSSVVSERALREIYLRGFEIAVKDGDAKSIMTVYNRINGTYGASNYDLTTRILREDWGYTGIVMTDWWAFCCDKAYEEGERMAHSYMVRAQNDLYMCCSSVERSHLNDNNTYEMFMKNDPSIITRRDLQRCAKNVLNFAINTPAMDRLLGTADEIEHIDSPFSADTIPVKADVYYEIHDEGDISFEQFDTVGGHDVVFGLTVDRPGLYEYTMTASSELSDIAQIPMTVFYTSIPVSVITWNGTGGKDVTRTMVGVSNGQHAIMRFAFGAPGVKLKSVHIRRTGDRPEKFKWGNDD